MYGGHLANIGAYDSITTYQILAVISEEISYYKY